MNLSLYINTAGNQLLAGLNQSTVLAPSSLPFFAGDTLQLAVFLLTPSASFSNGTLNYNVVSPNGLSLFFYIDDGAFESDVIYASLLGNSPDNNPNDGWLIDPTGTYFYGNISLNTVALQTAFAAASTLSAYLHVGYTQAGLQTTILRQQITIQAGVPNPAPASVPAGLTALSAQAANGMFLPLVTAPGQGVIFVSPLGKKISFRAIDNGDGTASVQETPLN